ncbi:MAG: hypothetical protein DRG69_05195 [Deltaproteobacteria bacterium]|nr:MAG: hypothetical protein DRG69_05195 [Deltaproteobacteria bacterium]
MAARGKAGYPPEIAPFVTHRWLPERERVALLVIDMQEYFRPLAGGIVERVRDLLGAFRRAQLPVVFTAHGHKDPRRDGGMLARWWGEVIQEGAFDHRFMEEVAPREGEKVIKKRRYSAFFATELEDYLRAKGVQDLVISGVMTNLCCETTARDAFMRDFRVFFLHDATATADPELHLASLKNLAYGFAVILSVEELMQALGL